MPGHIARHPLAKPRPHFEDGDSDGLVDLLARYPTGQAEIVFGALVACLHGESLDSKPLGGFDAVRTAPTWEPEAAIESARLAGVEPRAYLREAAMQPLRNPGTVTLARAPKPPEA